MRTLLKNLLGINRRSRPRGWDDVETDIPNVLASIGGILFMDPDVLKKMKIKKFKLSREGENMVYSALVGLGIFVVSQSIPNAVGRLELNPEKAQNIIEQISKDLQDASFQQLLTDGMLPDDLLLYNRRILSPLFEDMNNYMSRLFNFGETQQSRYPWGILGIVFERALGEQAASETRNDYFLFMEAQMYFDSLFVESINSFLTGGMANNIDNILRSPMGSQYGIS